MQKHLLICLVLVGSLGSLSAQNPGEEVLETYKIAEYTVKLIKYPQQQDTGNEREMPLTKGTSYGQDYFVYKNDSLINQVNFKTGECKLYVDERKRVNGFHTLINTIILDICNLTVRKETPPSIPWLNQEVDSITIFPLDSIFDLNYYQNQTTIITNYASRKPEKLNSKHTADFLSMFGHPSPIQFAPPSQSRTEHYKVSLYMNGQVYEIYLYYDMFFYQTWVYRLGDAYPGSQNAAKMIWDKHEAAKSTDTE